MSNWIDLRLDILTMNAEEINKLETALQLPCQELIEWVAQKWEEDPKEIATAIKSIVSFNPNATSAHGPCSE